MKVKNPVVKKLLEKYQEVSLVGQVSAIVSWDLQVNLPPKAAATRAEQSAYLSKLSTSLWKDTEFIETFEKAKAQKGLSVQEKAIIRNLERVFKYHLKIPEEAIIKFTKLP